MTFVCVCGRQVNLFCLLLYINQCLVFLLTLWSFAQFGPSFFLTLFSRIMPMIEMSWHTIYVNVLRWDCEPCDMHKSRSCASYLAHGSVVAYSCVQRPMYIYKAFFLSFFGLVGHLALVPYA